MDIMNSLAEGDRGLYVFFSIISLDFRCKIIHCKTLAVQDIPLHIEQLSGIQD